MGIQRGSTISSKRVLSLGKEIQDDRNKAGRWLCDCGEVYWNLRLRTQKKYKKHQMLDDVTKVENQQERHYGFQ